MFDEICLYFTADESGASDDEHFYPTTSDSDADQSRNNHNLSQPIAVTVNDVYKPPTELHRVGGNTI